MTTDGHDIFQAYFAGMEARDLPALRHLLACPLCQQMARLLLAQDAKPATSRPARSLHRSRPAAARRSGSRAAGRGRNPATSD